LIYRDINLIGESPRYPTKVEGVCCEGMNHTDKQITTVSFFKFKGWNNQFWAFSQMGLAPLRLGKPEGLSFHKFLGAGADNGFGIRPDWSVYGMLSVWENEAAADHFFQNNGVFLDYCSHSVTSQTIYLRNTMGHGQWDSQMPFESVTDFDVTQPIAVLTRATIKRRFLWQFWRQVPQVSRAISDKPGLHFAIGIGELPLIQQATFSLWASGKQMMAYAYQGEHHQKVIQQTRELGWYKEELFARFEPYRTRGEGFFQWPFSA
jgi:hypothetical protein